MKQKETMLSTLPELEDLLHDEIGDEHISTSIETPLRADAFELSEAEKMKKIEFHFKEIMHTWVWI